VFLTRGKRYKGLGEGVSIERVRGEYSENFWDQMRTGAKGEYGRPRSQLLLKDGWSTTGGAKSEEGYSN